MQEKDWRRLLSFIREGRVVPVLGPHLQVDGGVASRRWLAEKLLELHEAHLPLLPPGRELDEALAYLQGRPQNPIKAQDIYTDVHDLLAEHVRQAPLPEPLCQLGEISDFRLYVSLTPDDLAARAIGVKRALHEVIHAPNLTSGAGRDLPRNWRERAGDAHLLYLFGKSSPAPQFALHDEDLLEYARNLFARGSQTPEIFLDALQESGLLLLGCDYPDWLTRFLLRLTRNTRLSINEQREWLVPQATPETALIGFLQRYSGHTQVLSEYPPAAFVAELHRRWLAEQVAVARPVQAQEAVPQAALFFISYSRVNDLPRALALQQSLRALGAAEGEIWLDRQAIEPGDDFRRRILEGIQSCRYFLPLLSEDALKREEGFVFREWRAAEERRPGMNRDFLLPLVVDADYAPVRYAIGPAADWSGIDFGHAPEGAPDERTGKKLQAWLRQAHGGNAQSQP